MKKIMSRLYWFLQFVMIALIFASCNNIVPNAPTQLKNAAIAASIQIADGKVSSHAVQDVITKITLTVSGSSIDTIRKDLVFTGGHAKTQVTVPTDKDLMFKATAYQGTVAILAGQKQFKAASGQQNKVQINMDFLIPALILTPSDSTVNKNGEFTVFVEARKCSNLTTIGTRIQFDKNAMQVTQLSREDDFLKGNSGSINQLRFTRDNNLGTVDIALGVFPASASVTGEGKIGKIVFKTLTADTANILLSIDNSADQNLGIFDQNANLISTAIALGSRIIVK